MYDLVIPEVETPERYRPAPELVATPEHRPTIDPARAGWIDVRYRDEVDKWITFHPVMLDVIAGLEKGGDWETLYASLQEYPEVNLTRKSLPRIARKFTWSLHRMGWVHFDLEAPPAVFNDRYTRLKELGRGGLGVAYLCRDEQTGANVVVKHPWGLKGNIQSAQKSIAVEIKVLSELNHPGLPTYVDHFTVRGSLHLVRDFVDGVNLARHVHAHPDRILDGLRQVASIMAYLHDHGHLVYDPSPDNFLVLADGTVQMSDVGGCGPHEDGIATVKGRRGTGGYVASELRIKTKGGLWASIRSDIYSFGALAYALAVGRRPKKLWHHDDIVADLIERGDIDAALINLIDQCTRHDPEERPADMHAVRELLG